jgi:hypothetical protein
VRSERFKRQSLPVHTPRFAQHPRRAWQLYRRIHKSSNVQDLQNSDRSQHTRLNHREQRNPGFCVALNCGKYKHSTAAATWATGWGNTSRIIPRRTLLIAGQPDVHKRHDGNDFIQLPVNATDGMKQCSGGILPGSCNRTQTRGPFTQFVANSAAHASKTQNADRLWEWRVCQHRRQPTKRT